MTVNLHVHGMDCPDCAAKLEGSIKRLPGVTSAHVDFAGGILTAEVDVPGTEQRVRQTIRSLGYGVDDGTQQVTSELQIKGMDCPDEKALVEKVLTDIPGLERFEANLMTGRLRIVHDPKALPRIMAALKMRDLRQPSPGRHSLLKVSGYVMPGRFPPVWLAHLWVSGFCYTSWKLERYGKSRHICWPSAVAAGSSPARVSPPPATVLWT